MLAFKRKAQAIVIGHQLGQKPRFQIGQDFGRVGRVGIDICSHGYDPLAVGVMDHRIAAFQGDRRHFAKRDLTSVRGADPHVLHIAECPALGFRIAYHDAYIVTATLYTQGLSAKKTLPHLASQIRHGQAQHPRFGLQRQTHLNFARAKVVLNVKHARVGLQLGLNTVGRLA